MMNGILLLVFEISGRGCVAVVEVTSGNCLIGDSLNVDGRLWTITGIEMPYWTPEAIDRMNEGWVPPLALLLSGSIKSDLLPAVGRECYTDRRVASEV